MSMLPHYDPNEVEPRLQDQWGREGIYRYQRGSRGPTFSIDTPPPTVSGHLHLGHVYSYSQTDFMARFWRMNGYDVFYPMGFDDNGLPTERLVEKQLGIDARTIGRQIFIENCLQISKQIGEEYRSLWQRLALSIDWDYSYRTIGELARRTSQLSFIHLYQKGMIYRDLAPSIWCSECRTALAQADLNDLQRERKLYTIAFHTEDGSILPIATTRPELLPACVAVFIHPEDEQHRALIGQQARTPLFNCEVPILEDARVDRGKGTGIVMCCTFGDTTDIDWWRTYHLPLKTILDGEGRLTQEAGDFTGMKAVDAHHRMVAALAEQGFLLKEEIFPQIVRAHERCDTPVEYLVTKQWFIRILDFKDKFLQAGEGIKWHPEYMKMRYRQWVENLNWDWLISRQRFFGVPFPLWYCEECGQVIFAEQERLPIDPLSEMPKQPCPCGSHQFIPEKDVMDTWATSSLSPQIVGRWLEDPQLYQQVFPMSLRPQAHEIIRTWAFYTIVKSVLHFGEIPWKDIAISGWGIAPSGKGKISKSRGGGLITPMSVIERHSADGVRYWAASSGYGKDAVIDEQKIRNGARLNTKLWNVARFSEPFLSGERPRVDVDQLLPVDRWILSRTQRVIHLATTAYRQYDYVSAKNETENLFWHDLADNYIELAKHRLYQGDGQDHEKARYTLYHVFLTILKLFAPLLPHITEEVFRILYAEKEGRPTIHLGPWPQMQWVEQDELIDAFGIALMEVLTTVRRIKSEERLPLSREINRIQVAITNPGLVMYFHDSLVDLQSATRARIVEIVSELPVDEVNLSTIAEVGVALRL